MNSILMFKSKVVLDFVYLRMGDAFRSLGSTRIKIFIRGGIEKFKYIEELKHYKVLLKILYFDVKDKKFNEEYIKIYTQDLNKINFEIVGVYRKIY